MRTATRRLFAIAACCCLYPCIILADTQVGTRLDEYLESLRASGVRVIYSSDLVSDTLVLTKEPDADDPVASLARILAPHGLAVVDGPSGSLLVVRGEQAPEPGSGMQPAQPTPLPEITVTASLHRLQYAESGSHTYLDRELATRIPSAAEEAVRLTNRLPGTAGGGISSRNHVRGGEVNEVLFLFDGLRLYEPYHLKDFQSVATIVNSNAVVGIDLYTGSYPVRYGDRMSGVMSMNLREPVAPVETELALSFFNASALSLGTFGTGGNGDWLVAARRGNLDLIVDVVDPDYGSPDYHDLLVHVGWDFGPQAQLSANVLLSHDKISLTDSDLGESASAKYDNRVFWFRWNADWNDRLRSETIVSFNDIENRRNGTLNLPGIVTAALDETRNFEAFEIKQDWTYHLSKSWMLSLGLRARDQDADYAHTSAKSVLPPFDQILDNQPLMTRDIALSPGGAQYAAYSELRWQALDALVFDFGIRWDQQTYTTANDDKQYSPRVSVLYQPSDKTELRLGFGQFYQAQEINELQVSDGVPDFFPAQRARHAAVNLKHRFDVGVDIDVSAYRKAFRSLRPRFENAFNSLSLLPELQFDRVRIDAPEAESIGVELMASHGSGEENLFWWFGYAWAEVEDSTANGKSKRSWDQTHTVKGGVSWRWRSWDISAAGEVHTGWPRTLLGEEFNSSRYSVFHALDARISRDFALKRGELTAFLEVANLYDRANPCCTEYFLQAGPGGIDELVANETHWLPIVPSLGVVWRF